MTDETVRVVPRRSLLVSAFVSILVVLVPLSLVLYWFAVPRGQGGWVVLADALVVVAAVGMLLRQLSLHTTVADGELHGNGIFSPLVRVPLDRIAQVDLVPVYIGQSPEPVLQLLVRDADGRRLFRMRGTYWHTGDLERVAAALPVPTTVATEPIPVADFFRAYPSSAYWFENRPWLVTLLVGSVIAAAIAIAVGVMVLIGMPIMA